jgi:hypothetical protein
MCEASAIQNNVTPRHAQILNMHDYFDVVVGQFLLYG